ncbi:MAG: NosD domain-containing protein [Rhodobacter sp.]|nr:NosD domain-containing protein [Rhodobacter sp.]
MGKLILVIAVSLSACTIGTEGTSMNISQLMVGGIIEIPESGIDITETVILDKKTTLVGQGLWRGGEIRISGEGRLLFEVDGYDGSPNIVLRGVRVVWSRDLTHGGHANRAIGLNCDGIEIERSHFRVESWAEGERNPYLGPAGWLFQVGRGNRSNLVDISVIESTFEAENEHTVGLAITYDVPGAEYQDLTWDSNVVDGFHGALYLSNVRNPLVSGNSFFRNSFGNIVVNGRYAAIINNDIKYSGNGTSGDGITAVLEKSLIMGNQVYSGSCYGIAVSQSSDVRLYKNIVINDITSAILIDRSVSIDIRRNSLLNNSSFGIRLEDVSHSTVKSNYFSGNGLGPVSLDADCHSNQIDTQ